VKRLVPFLLLAVACHSRRHDADSPPWEISPAGYSVCYIDQGTVVTGRATKEQIYKWHAAAVDRAALELQQKYGVDPARTHQTALKVAWSLIDNCVFFVDGNTAIPATGQWIPYANTIRVCLYCREEGPKAMIPPDAPPWTIRQSPTGADCWRWGVLREGRWFPATAHEIGHVLFGENFEH